MNVSKEILDFLTGIHGSENRKEEMFNRAFELAYKDMATHTVAYKKEAKSEYFYDYNNICNENRKAVKECIKAFVEKEIFGGVELKKLKESLAEQSFDNWHEKACDSFSSDIAGEVTLKTKSKDEKHESLSNLIEHKNEKSDNLFTIGQAQKLINMMIKYLYIYNKCEEENERVLKSEDLSNIEEYAHAAIDDKVLKKVYEKENYKYTKWSDLQEYPEKGGEDTYCKYKEKIKEVAKDEKMFLWELKYWPFDKDQT